MWAWKILYEYIPIQQNIVAGGKVPTREVSSRSPSSLALKKTLLKRKRKAIMKKRKPKSEVGACDDVIGYYGTRVKFGPFNTGFKS